MQSSREVSATQEDVWHLGKPTLEQKLINQPGTSFATTQQCSVVGSGIKPRSPTRPTSSGMDPAIAGLLQPMARPPKVARQLDVQAGNTVEMRVCASGVDEDDDI